MNLVQVCAPINEAEEETMDFFTTDSENNLFIDQLPKKDLNNMIEDPNGKIGHDNTAMSWPWGKMVKE